MEDWWIQLCAVAQKDNATYKDIFKLLGTSAQSEALATLPTDPGSTLVAIVDDELYVVTKNSSGTLKKDPAAMRIVKEGYLNVKTDFQGTLMKGVPSSARSWRVYHMVLSGQKLLFYQPTDDLAKILFTDAEKIQQKDRPAKKAETSGQHSEDLGIHVAPSMFDDATVNILFKGDTMTKLQYGDEFSEVDYSGREKGASLLMLLDGKVVITKKTKGDSLLRAMSVDPKFKYVRSAPVMMTKVEEYNDSLGLVDVFQLRMVGLSYLFKAPNTNAKKKWMKKFEEIAQRLRDQQTSRYTLSSEQMNLIFEGQSYVFAPFENNMVMNPIFEEKMQSRRAAKKAIKGGNVSALVEELIFLNQCSDFMEEFLFSFETFMHFEDFVSELQKICFSLGDPNLLPTDQTPKEVCQRILLILTAWTDKNAESLQNPAILFPLGDFLKEIEKFAQEFELTTEFEKLQVVATLKPHITRFDSVDFMFSPTRTPFKGTLCNVEEFLQMSDTVFAQQLTLVEQGLMRAVKPTEILKRLFVEKHHHDRETPNICTLVDHFARMSQIATTLVVKTRKLQDRVTVLKKLIKIATICRKMHNYNSMNEIISGLHVPAVYRLRRTWASISKETREEFAECINLMDNEENQNRFEQVLKEVPPDVPCIPYFGYFLDQIHGLEDQPDLLLEGVINFQKRVIVFHVANKFVECIKNSYSFEPEASVQKLITTWKGLGDEECFNESLESEPKELANNRFSFHGDQSTENTNVFSRFTKKEDKELVLGAGKGVKQGLNVVLAGTLDKLIGKLFGEFQADPSILDSEYLHIFLLTYRTFTSPVELIDRIDKRFVPFLDQFSVAPSGGAEEILTMKKIRDILLMRFLKICTTWVDNYFQDFQDDAEVAAKFLETTDRILGPLKQAWSDGLKKTFQRKLLAPPASTRPFEYSVYSLPSVKPVDLLAQDVNAVANELLLIGLRMLKEITPRDYVSAFEELESVLPSVLKPSRMEDSVFLDDILIQTVITKTEEKIKAGNLRLPHSVETYLIYFLKIRDWVTHEIIEADNPKHRAEKFVFFIQVAMKCNDLLNLYGSRAIVMGLISPFSRVFVSSWKWVSESDIRRLEKLWTHASLEAVPVVPDPGPILESLLELAKTPNLTAQGFINYEKRMELYTIIQQFMKSRYEPPSVKESKDYLQQTICKLRDPLGRELFGKVKAKAISENKGEAASYPKEHFFWRIAIAEIERASKEAKDWEKNEKELAEKGKKAKLEKPASRKAILQQEKQRKEEKQKQELERLKGVMKARDRSEKKAVHEDLGQPVMRINLANSTTDIAYNYIKKEFVFKIATEEGVQFLLQAIDKEDMLAWIKAVKQVIERASVIRHKSVLSEISVEDSEMPKFPPKKASNAQNAVFGLSLQELAERDLILVPVIVEECLAEVEKRGLSEEGIYRLSGSSNSIQELKAQFDQGAEDMDLSKVSDINTISGVLKLFFRELSDPVIPFSLYSGFMEALSAEDYNEKMWKMKELLYEFPAPNYAVLRRIIGHLERVTDFEEVNQMYTNNLAIVFGPTLVRAPPELGGIAAMMNMGKHNALVKDLILQYHWLFDVEEEEGQD